jgi:hypothetical protein
MTNNTMRVTKYYRNKTKCVVKNVGYMNSSSHNRRQTVLTRQLLYKSEISKSERTYSNISSAVCVCELFGGVREGNVKYIRKRDIMSDMGEPAEKEALPVGRYLSCMLSCVWGDKIVEGVG